MKIIGEIPERERLEVAQTKVLAAMYGWGIILQKHPRVISGDMALMVKTMNEDLSVRINELEAAEKAWEPIAHHYQERTKA